MKIKNRVEFVDEDELTIGEKIIYAACVVAIFAGCYVLGLMLCAVHPSYYFN